MSDAGEKKTPRVTVLMPVYNGGRYLRDALDSILAQTFTDFEFLVIDDGSTDNSAAIVSACSDSRIRLVRQPTNRGLIAALNLGLEMSRGEFIARMDADDISLPERLTRQVAYLDANPEVGICGSWLEAFTDISRTVWRVPAKHEEIICSLIFESVVYHPTVIIRKRSLSAHRLHYDSRFPHAEDYEFWSRCGQHFQLANINEVLLRYRLHENSVGQTHAKVKFQSADRVRENMVKWLKLAYDEEEMSLHCLLGKWQTSTDPLFIEQSHHWLLKLKAANAETQCYPEPIFSQTLTQRWQYVCCQASARGFYALRQYYCSPLRVFASLTLREQLLFLVFSLMKHDRCPTVTN